jgi:hypothetical protein
MTAGPPPKDRSARRRRNAPAGGEWVDLPPVDKQVIRALPRRSGEGAWSARARATWGAWGRDPATTQWSPADVAYAIDTLYLVDLCARRPTSSLAAEIRLRMDGLGLTPKGKRNLRWRVAAPAEVVQHPTSSTDQRRGRLRAVDSAQKATREIRDGK